MKRNNPRDRIKLLRRNHQTLRDREVPAFSSTEQSIRKEIAVMKKCRHANIARLFEVIDDPQQDKIYLGESCMPPFVIRVVNMVSVRRRVAMWCEPTLLSC